MSQTVTVRPGFNSGPIPVAPFSLITVSPMSSASLVYTEDSLTAINNGSATWAAWPSGTVTSQAQQMSNSQMFVMMSANTDNATLTIGDPNPKQYQVDPSPWSGILAVGAGSASAPSYSFAGDTDTGIANTPSVGGIVFVSNGTTVAGIGTFGGAQLQVGVSTAISWSNGGQFSPSDVLLLRDAGDVLALRHGASSQTMRIYGTSTEHMSFTHNGTSAVVSTTIGNISLSASSMSFYGVTGTSRPAGISTRSASSGALASTLAMVLNSLGLINCTSVAG